MLRHHFQFLNFDFQTWRESWASYSQILGKEEHWTNVNLLLICAN